MTRTLEIIPILHTEADLGGLADALRERVGEAAWQQRQQVIAAFWQSVSRWAAALSDLDGVLVYQDALPSDGEPMQIVRQLAGRGSANHAILLDLAERGARLIGTEDPALLIREVELAREAAEGRADHRHEFRSRRVLELRDRAIAERIDCTLTPGGRGILFIGMIHAVEGVLPADIEVRHPLGRTRPSVRRGA